MQDKLLDDLLLAAGALKDAATCAEGIGMQVDSQTLTSMVKVVRLVRERVLNRKPLTFREPECNGNYVSVEELREMICKQYGSDPEAADAISTASSCVPCQGHPDSIGQD